MLIVFGVLAVVGMIFFSAAGGKTNSVPGVEGNIVVWGTLAEQAVIPVLQGIAEQYNGFDISYDERNEETYEQDLLEALASGVGPDLFQVDNTSVLRHRSKLFVIPYDNYPARNFESSFVDSADIFRDDGGVLAFPVSVDPLVMYYNQATLTSAFAVNPPGTWQELTNLAVRLTVYGNGNSILRSGIALGVFQNITHAKDILSLLLLQSGNDIVANIDGRYRSVLTSGIDPERVIPRAIEYFVAFADPSSTAYMWNSGMPDARTSFLSEQTAFYLGFASEYESLIKANPNLDIGMTIVPQLDASESKLTVARVSGFAISKVSTNIAGAYVTGQGLSTDFYNETLVSLLGLSSPIRSLLAVSAPDASLNEEIIRQSAIISHTWSDPDGIETDRIFTELVSRIRSGADTAEQSLSRATAALNRLLQEFDYATSN